MKKINNNKNTKRHSLKIRVFSKKLGKVLKVKVNPDNLPKELYETVGMSNADYGS